MTPRIVVRPTGADGQPIGPAEPLVMPDERGGLSAARRGRGTGETGSPARPARPSSAMAGTGQSGEIAAQPSAHRAADGRAAGGQSAAVATRRGRHAAPAPKRALRVPSNRLVTLPIPVLPRHSAPAVAGVLGFFVVVGLGLGPLLGRLGSDTPLASLAVASLVLGLPTLSYLLFRRRKVLNGLLYAACTVFSLGLASITVFYVLAGRPHELWLIGQVVLCAATPILAVAVWARRRHTEGLRPHAFTLLAVDAAMMACAWGTMLWHQYLWRGELTVDGSRGVHLSLLLCDLFMVSLLLLIASTAADLSVVLTCLAVLCVAIADVITLAPGLGLAAATWFIALAWLMLVGAAFTARTLRRHSVQVSDSDPEQRAGLVTLVNVLVPIGVAFGGLAATLEVDRVTVLLAGMVILIFGVRELVRARQAARLVELLADQAMHDPLTGLSNRRALGDRLRELAQTTVPVTVLTLDVDRFKLVNTEFGHSIGDEVLAAVGAALRETCGPLAAQPFRLGGDEFAVVAIGEDEIGLMLAERVRASVVAHTNRIAGVENLGLTASVGVAPLARSGDPLDSLGRSAEALRVAKQERNKVRLYTDDLVDEANRRIQLETRLRAAIGERRVAFHYQPIVDLRSGRIMGMESLARWEDADLGIVSPADFVPMAEQTGLIHDLGRQAIESALRVAVHGTHASGRLSYVAVNVSPLQLRRPQFVEEVTELVATQHARPSMLKLEVTEGIFMDTDDPAVENLRKLSGLGIGIAIDDFGSGYSSLGYMSRLPIETVKVDRILTQQVDDSRTRSVVKALVWVAEAHGLQVILEGVENEQTAATLRRLGVRWGQGWLWSRAVPELEVPGVLADLGTVPPITRRSEHHIPRFEDRELL